MGGMMSTHSLACLPLPASVSVMSRTEAHAATMQREAAVSAVFKSSGLAQERTGGRADESGEEEGEEEAAAAATGQAKKRARRDSGSSAGGAAERHMSMFAEVMSKFYTPPAAPAAAAAAAPYTAEQWLTDCMVSDEQRKALADLPPDPTKPFTPLILSSFDAATLTACGLKPFQLSAWEKLAAKHA